MTVAAASHYTMWMTLQYT